MKLTSQQSATRKSLVKKFKNSIYTKKDGNLNLNVIRQIAVAAGLKNPDVGRNASMGYETINSEIIDPYGNPVGEITTIYDFCLWLKTREDANVVS